MNIPDIIATAIMFGLAVVVVGILVRAAIDGWSERLAERDDLNFFRPDELEVRGRYSLRSGRLDPARPEENEECSN